MRHRAAFRAVGGSLQIDPLIRHFYEEVAGPYWPPESRLVEDGCRSFDFPLWSGTAPPLANEVQWQASDLIGYLGTCSAVRGLEKAQGREPFEQFQRDYLSLWNEPQRRRAIRFSLSLRVGRI